MHLPGLKEVRTRRELSQVELARRAGVAQYYLSKVEAGKQGCRREVVQKLAEVLNVDPKELLGASRPVRDEHAKAQGHPPDGGRTTNILEPPPSQGGGLVLHRHGGREFNRYCKGLSWEELVEVVSSRGWEVEFVQEVLREEGPLPEQVRVFLEEVLGHYPEQDIQLLVAARRNEPSEEGREVLARGMRKFL